VVPGIAALVAAAASAACKVDVVPVTANEGGAADDSGASTDGGGISDAAADSDSRACFPNGHACTDRSECCNRQCYAMKCDDRPCVPNSEPCSNGGQCC
jgi:hypothetical protein